jgi:hypothetical protein
MSEKFPGTLLDMSMESTTYTTRAFNFRKGERELLINDVPRQTNGKQADISKLIEQHVVQRFSKSCFHLPSAKTVA